MDLELRVISTITNVYNNDCTQLYGHFKVFIKVVVNNY